MNTRSFASVLAAFVACLWLAPQASALPPLSQAAAEGNIDEVQRLLIATPDALLQRDEQGCVPLHQAAWNGQALVVEALLKAGTPVDYPKRMPGQVLDGATALHHAAVNGQTDVVKLLLKYGAKVDAQDAELNTPLHHAAWNNRVEVAKMLLDAGANPNARRNAKVMPLEEAAYFGYEDMARLLIARGADVNARVHEGSTPLHQAARQGHWQMCILLKQAKAELESRDDEGRTPLHVAAQSGQVGPLLMLIAMGADINATNDHNQTPLALAQGATQGYLQSELKQRSEADAADAARTSWNAKLPRPAVPSSRLVYQRDWEDGKFGPEWSTSPTGASVGTMEVKSAADGTHRFLGEFCNQAVRLSLAKLPPHRQVTVTVNVVALFSWDGNSTGPGTGPDIWEANLVGGPTLFRTTFCNMVTPLTDKVPFQAFPGEWPHAYNPGTTGALARNLFKRHATKDDPAGQPDGVYRVSFTFAHDTPNLVLQFGTRNLEDLANESWGLGRIEVRVGGAASAQPAPKPRRTRH